MEMGHVFNFWSMCIIFGLLLSLIVINWFKSFKMGTYQCHSDSAQQLSVLFVNLISTWRQALLSKVLSLCCSLCEIDQDWRLGAEKRADGFSSSVLWCSPKDVIWDILPSSLNRSVWWQNENKWRSQRVPHRGLSFLPPATPVGEASWHFHPEGCISGRELSELAGRRRCYSLIIF